MALRSLVVKLMALPLRVPGSRAFGTAPKPKPKPALKLKGYLSEEIAAACRREYNSIKEAHDTLMPLIKQRDKFTREQFLKRRNAILLIGFGGAGSIGYLLSSTLRRGAEIPTPKKGRRNTHC